MSAGLLDPALPAREAQDDGSSRWYEHPETGEPYVSVTWVTGTATHKPFLMPWATKVAAEYAVDFRDTWGAVLREHGRDAAVDHVKQVARANREAKADLGRYWHRVMEALVLGVPLPGIPEHLDGHVVEFGGDLTVVDQTWLDAVSDGFLNFVADFDAEPLASEATVASDEHAAAGTIDGIYRLHRLGGRVLGVDGKSGAHLGREVYAQLGAYDRFPDLWLRNGLIVSKPPVEGWAVLHLRPGYRRGYKLLDVPPERLAAGWAWWLQCRAQVEAAEAVPDRFGRAVYPARPDGSQPAPMVEDLASYPGCSRVVRPLVAAGFEWLSDLTLLSPVDLLAVKGIGPKAVAALSAVLAEHGLSLAAETSTRGAA